MNLTREEQQMLSGANGEGYKKVMEILVELGEFYKAKRLVPVSLGYITLGPTPGKPGKAIEWLEELVDLGVTFKCPVFVPTDFGGRVGPDYEINRKLGAIFAYQGGGHARNPFYLPVFGQHIIGDGTCVTHYMNSYIGARANTEDFIGEYSAAIVGKTPEYGLHLTENRIGKTLFDIKVRLKDETDWSALGYYISRTLGTHYWDIPVINGVGPDEVTNDDLDTFSSSVPAYGACVHSLLVGISPEARTLEQAFAGAKPKQTFVVGSEELNGVYKTFSAVEEKPDMISVGGFGVNVSIDTVMKLVNLLEGKKVSEDFPTVIALDGPVKLTADGMGLTDKLRKAGVMIGMNEFMEAHNGDTSNLTSSPVMSAKRYGLKNIVFTDAKTCHYIENQGVNSVLKHIEEVAKIAISGRIEV